MHKLFILFFVMVSVLSCSVYAVDENCVCNCDNCANATITLNMHNEDRNDCVDPAAFEVKHQLDLLKATNEVLLARVEALTVRNTRRPRNCAEALDMTGRNKSGLYSIQFENIINSQPFLVYCDQNTHDGGWTVIQRRLDGSVDFFRDWSEYKMGFGNLDGEFWIGLDKLHTLTTQSPQELLIIMEDFENITKYAKYSSFAIGSESEAYALNVLGNYTGTAGDSLTYQASMKFSTKDEDNDVTVYDCGREYRGGWWYKDCHRSNLNGAYLRGAYTDDNYARGVAWVAFRGYNYSLKFVKMMIRPQRQ